MVLVLNLCESFDFPILQERECTLLCRQLGHFAKLRVGGFSFVRGVLQNEQQAGWRRARLLFDRVRSPEVTTKNRPT